MTRAVRRWTGSGSPTFLGWTHPMDSLRTRMTSSRRSWSEKEASSIRWTFHQKWRRSHCRASRVKRLEASAATSKWTLPGPSSEKEAFTVDQPFSQAPTNHRHPTPAAAAEKHQMRTAPQRTTGVERTGSEVTHRLVTNLRTRRSARESNTTKTKTTKRRRRRGRERRRRTRGRDIAVPRTVAARDRGQRKGKMPLRIWMRTGSWRRHINISRIHRQPPSSQLQTSAFHIS